jgi:hypothetical protein
MKNDPALEAVRAVRLAISHEFDNDPGRLIAHYIEMQSQIRDKSVIVGPGEPAPIEAVASVARTAQLGVAADDASHRR